MKFFRIWVMGDIHGSILPIENFWRRNKDTINFSPETDCIILLGDVGANYYLNKKDDKFKSQLALDFPFTYFCIRGNHEDRPTNLAMQNPDKWDIMSFFDGTVWVEQPYPNIKYAADYPSIYYINGYKTLIIPGAYSVDKYYRLRRGWNWFPDEQLTLNEMNLGRKLLETNPAFDLVLSHTCPLIYVPTDLFLSSVDQSTVDNTMERYLGEIEFNITYKLWIWGHFHKFRIYPASSNSQCGMLSDGQEAINLQEWMEDFNNIYKRY